jgi:murein DD-endopeptidase MepM/ murein hydrolase activator NlpD
MERRSHHRKFFAAILALAFGVISCSLGPRASREPIFIPLPGANQLTVTLPQTPQAAEDFLPSPAPPLASSNPGQADPTEEPTAPETTIPPTPTLAPLTLPPSASATPPLVNTTPWLYYTQAGDTLPVVAFRFGVQPEEISSPEPLPEKNLLNPGQLLVIPRRIANTTSPEHLLPDSEIVFSPSAVDFDVREFVAQAGGYLSTFAQYLGTTGNTSGADVIYRVAIENSINPRILLALLEYESGWIYGTPENSDQIDYPMGLVVLREKGLYQQLTWAMSQLTSGYYGWREGRLVELNFSDGITARLSPDLNAGTTALQYFFAQRRDSQGWLEALDKESGFPALYERMFGSPWVRAQTVEPLYPPDLTQPPLILPFMVDQIWGFTGGPHGAWKRDGAWAAVDFAPGSMKPGCVDTDAHATAAAAGLVVRSRNAVVTIDLDGDGREQTGWVLMYLHVAEKGRIPEGTWVEAGDPIGFPSCEGGFSTGTHVHLARKYNGEWIVADGPLPFVLSGWTVHAGKNPYEGTLTRGDQIIRASTLSPFSSRVIRRADDP